MWASAGALGGRPSPFGELLIDAFGKPPLFSSTVSSRGGTDVHRMPVPLQAVGRSFSLQALVLSEHGPILTNAIDLVIKR